MSVPGEWSCLEFNCGVVNDGPDLYDIMYGHELRCRGCGAKVKPDLHDLIPYIQELFERIERLEALVCPDRDTFKAVDL